MAYFFIIKPTGAYIYFELLDGDRIKITTLDRSVAVGINPPEQIRSTTCGRAIDPTHLPTRLRPKYGARGFDDLMSSQTGTLCSPKVREIVEHFEPGIHAFYPVTFEWRNGKTRDDYMFWIVQRTVKALHPDHLNPPYPGPNEFWDGYYPHLHPDGRMVLSKDAISGAHIWVDPQLSDRQCISDELAKAFQSEGVTGFEPGNHIEER